MINSRIRVSAAGRPQTARILEYVGVVLLALFLVIGIAVAGWGGQLRGFTAQVACSVTPQPDCPAPPSGSP
ncbi:hypothetical protein [Microlunatus speluncae]|uniref:hypothetical protein n=1 Tax=Microlunatus speluncae TaxID=2594267 RepID=UPI0012663D7F|nr:hypothetical protein [Microlunatus speluncae]